jgi:hypothetical protein
MMLYLAVAVLTVFLFFGDPHYYASRSFKAFWNPGHIGYYTLVAFILLRQWTC